MSYSGGESNFVRSWFVFIVCRCWRMSFFRIVYVFTSFFFFLRYVCVRLILCLAVCFSLFFRRSLNILEKIKDNKNSIRFVSFFLVDFDRNFSCFVKSSKRSNRLSDDRIRLEEQEN